MSSLEQDQIISHQEVQSISLSLLQMSSKVSQHVNLTIIFLLTIMFSVKKTQSQIWEDLKEPWSCGNLTNIRYPFKLSFNPTRILVTDTIDLKCEDNNHTTVLYPYFGGKYLVKEIDYQRNKMLVVDLLNDPNNVFTTSDYTYDGNATYYITLLASVSSVVAYLDCDEPVPSASYLEIKGRLEGKYSYVLMGEVTVTDVADACTVSNVVLIMPRLNKGVADARNYTYEDVLNAKDSGFELQWVWDIDTGYSWTAWTWYIIQTSASLLLFLMSSRNLFLLPFVCLLLVFEFKRQRSLECGNIDSFLESHNDLMPIRYSYFDIKRITKGFNEKLGEGGYGSVFKGKLKSGQIVAVKLLNMPKANGQEFINEIAAIGTIHHSNIVRLVGYCFERSKRALVYDYMPNGSLEKYVLSKEWDFSLSCEKLYEISLGVARGVEYLHRGCDMQILHFDIKPHNILLDESFNPKVSDFGLAKLYPTDDSIVSLTAARGTMGYMAPEMFYKNIGGISYKADVYSFGMLLMEIVGRRRNVDAFAENMSDVYFPSWIHDRLNEGTEIEMGEAISEFEREMVRKMIVVALWCIQTNPSDRPSMGKVVEMLEGSFELLEMPPKPNSLCPIGNEGENADPRF